MELVTSFENLSLYKQVKVKEFLRREIPYLNIKGVMLMHGTPDLLSNITLLDKFLQALPEDVDPKKLKYLSCYGAQMPELIKSRHLYPIDDKLILSLKGDKLEVYV